MITLPVVHLSVAQYKGELRLFISFLFNHALTRLVTQLPGVQWSRSNRAWYLSYRPDLTREVKRLFGNNAVFDFVGVSPQLTPLLEAARKPIRKETVNIPPPEIVAFLTRFREFLQSRRYSDSTVKTYVEALRIFFTYLEFKRVEEINNEDLLRFNLNYILANNYSASYQNQAVNAIKLFFAKLGETQLNIELVTRPRTEKRLPNVLSKEEVKKILETPVNVKHRAMLSLIYACGLRCGELLRLLPSHVDTNRGLLIIKMAKGKKDRIVPLNGRIVELLREYYKMYKPKKYLFEGQRIGEPYDIRSLQLVLRKTVKKTGIYKPITLHWLRHSYATHLLEGGTDLRYIQEILGHRSSKTTEVYTYVSNKSIQRITSPFDSL